MGVLPGAGGGGRWARLDGRGERALDALSPQCRAPAVGAPLRRSTHNATTTHRVIHLELSSPCSNLSMAEQRVLVPDAGGEVGLTVDLDAGDGQRLIDVTSVIVVGVAGR